MRNRLGFGVAVLLATGACTAAAQGGPCGPATQSSYEDSEAGLQRLLEDIVNALKSSKKKEAEALAGSLLIPEPRPCFTSIFGEEEGKRLGEMYRKVRGFRRELIPLELQNAAKKNSHIQIKRIESAQERPRSRLRRSPRGHAGSQGVLRGFLHRGWREGFLCIGPLSYTQAGGSAW